MPAVEFNPEEFKALYPRIADFSDAQLNHAFNLACELVNNTDASSIPYNPPATVARKLILYALVCHLCELALRGGGLVGSLSSAAEGSVSTGFAVPTNPNAAWYNQTQCGATAFQLMQPFIMGGRAYRGCFR